MNQSNPFFFASLPKERYLHFCVLIAQGLLASGHFTKENDQCDYGDEQLLMIKSSRTGKYSMAVCDAATSVLSDLMSKVEQEISQGYWPASDHLCPEPDDRQP